ncbi:hypothetical protein Tco_0937552 [Tanacetum coccineum]|uniref:Uncharacterized protein n=1 Tax=Tanacetum coccineum TaxID=301880 RepID=A0ABQ5DFN4_9ASTR
MGNVHLDELLQDQNMNMEAEESSFDIEFEIKFSGNVDPEMNIDVDFTFIGSSSFDQEMEEADSDLESMPDYEIVQPCKQGDANTSISIASALQLSIVFASSSALVVSPGDVQALIAKLVWENKNICRRTIPHVQALGAMQRIDFLAALVYNLGLSLLDKFIDKRDSSVPRMVANAFEERMLKLLSDTLKNILPQLLNDSVKKLIPKFDKRVKKTLKAEVPKVVEKTSSDLHELVELVCQLVRIVDLVAPPINDAIEGEKESQVSQPDPAMEVPVSAQGEQQSSVASIGQMPYALVVHSIYAEPPTKKLKVLMDIPIPAPTPLNTFKPDTIDSIPYEEFTANLFSSGSSEYSPVPLSKVVDNGKGIFHTFDNDILKQVKLYMEEGGSAPNLSNLCNFRAAGEGPMALEEAKL